VQTQGGAPAAVAIERTGGKRYGHISVLVDWDRDGLYAHPMSDISSLVEEAVLSQQLTGSAPAEIMLVEGYAAAELQLTLEGKRNGLGVVALFSVYNGLSPLYTVDLEGCEVIYKIGIDTSVGTVWYQQMVGNIRTVSPQRANGQVVISVLDRAEAMRQPVRLPIWAVGLYQSLRGWNEAQLMESQWIIDHCLRAADASSTPMRWRYEDELGIDTNVVNLFWMSGAGSWLPNIGYVDSMRMQGFPRSETAGHDMFTRDGTPHPLVAAEAIADGKRPVVLAAQANDLTGFRPFSWPQYPGPPPDFRNYAFYKQYHAAGVEDMSIYGSHWFGFTMITSGQEGTYWQTASVDAMRLRLGALMQLFLQFNAGQVRIRFENLETGELHATPYVTIPTGLDSVQVDARYEVRNGAADRARLVVNGSSGGFGETTFTGYDGTVPADSLQGTLYLLHRFGVQDVYWTHWPNGGYSTGLTEDHLQATARHSARFGAVLDRGLNRLSVTPQSSYEDGWALASAVAAAELGAIYWDQNGIFRFVNRDTITERQATVVRTLDGSDFQDLGNTSSLDSLRNVVQADTINASSDLARIFEASDVDQFVIPALTFTEFVFTIDDMASVEATQVPRFASVPDANVPNAWNDSRDHGYVVQFQTGDDVWQEQNFRISGVDIRANVDRDYNLHLFIHNGYPQDARFATTGGQPALRIQGTKVTQLDNVKVIAKDVTSIHKFGPRNLPISGDWVQQQPGVNARLVDYVLDRAVKAIPATDDIPINGDPRLQLLDTIEVVDPDGLGESLLMQILGYRRVVSRTSGMTDNLTVELIRPSNVGLWDSAQYGRWDTTLIWGP
jgi:hypothetical protein